MKLVGKVREAHGLKGDLYVLIFSGDISWAKQMKSFGLKSKSDESPKVFSVERTKPFKKGLIVKASEILDRNMAEDVKGFEFYIADELLISKPGETIYLEEIKNFKLKDKDQKALGEIIGFSSNGAQDLLIVKTSTGTAEVPFVDAFIKKIDFKHKVLVMDLPEGLLDIENL